VGSPHLQRELERAQSNIIMAVKKDAMTKNQNEDAYEQVLYIGPEENITSVRERLTHTPACRVALVIPPQTLLRSHVAWRLLQKRAQELGKKVCIVSSDPQIRSIARSLKFKVASPTTFAV
jgi:hypothetical protein